MFHRLTRLAGSVLVACVFSGCMFLKNPRLAMSPCDLRGMLSLLEVHAEDEAHLLDALTATPEYRLFAQAVALGADKNAKAVCLLKEYEGGVFGALCLVGIEPGYRAIWLPVHKWGEPVTVQTGAVDGSQAKVVWDLLEASPWTEPPIYRTFRVKDETSPAPFFLLVHTPRGTMFHCATFSHHQTSYATLSHALVECVGGTSFMGRYEMLVLPPVEEGQTDLPAEDSV